MTAAGMRDLGDVLLRISTTFVGGLLLALALGVDIGSVHTWGWVVAMVAVPLSYAVRRTGEAEVAAEAASSRQLS